eukprot:5358436-Prorocentrum_lima.AAC.1
MTSSLVGSEMCIRDSRLTTEVGLPGKTAVMPEEQAEHDRRWQAWKETKSCLLYTSDAADDM